MTPLLQLVPQFEQVFGSQTTTSAFSRTVSSSEQNNSQVVMQNRFQKVFLRFLEHFARPEHPLVIFLDDMQWADVPSMKLLQAILVREKRKENKKEKKKKKWKKKRRENHQKCFANLRGLNVLVSFFFFLRQAKVSKAGCCSSSHIGM